MKATITFNLPDKCDVAHEGCKHIDWVSLHVHWFAHLHRRSIRVGDTFQIKDDGDKVIGKFELTATGKET